MPSDLSPYPAVVLFLPTVSESLLPVPWLPCPLPEDALQSYPAEASPDTENFYESSNVSVILSSKKAEAYAPPP